MYTQGQGEASLNPVMKMVKIKIAHPSESDEQFL